MLFNSLNFVLFFTVCFIIYWWVLRGNKARHAWLLILSYLFYAAWDYRFLVLIGFVTVVAYISAIAIEKHQNKSKKKLVLWVSIFLYLAVLCVFKYFDFFVDSFVVFLTELGVNAHVETLKIILPVGISFYTFQAVSYTVDVYRRELSPDHSLLEVALYIAFFPQLVAGPIVRATDFFPQLRENRTLNKFAIPVCQHGPIQSLHEITYISGLRK